MACVVRPIGMPIITWTTEFGTRDGYVGAMKGVIARIAPDVTILDIAHDVPRGDIAHAAWVVRTSTLEFPHDTVHVVVVDPGVGSARPAVIARVPASGPLDPPRAAQLYVGPDNGVFAYLPIDKAWTIRTGGLARISATFHGRDVFAPIAAMVAKGRPDVYGAYHTLAGKLPWSGEGHVVHVDHYGNLISSLRPQDGPRHVRIAGHLVPIVRTYSDVSSGALLAYTGSAGTVEVAVRDGRADTKLGVARGERVDFELAEGPYR